MRVTRIGHLGSISECGTPNTVTYFSSLLGAGGWIFTSQRNIDLGRESVTYLCSTEGRPKEISLSDLPEGVIRDRAEALPDLKPEKCFKSPVCKSTGLDQFGICNHCGSSSRLHVWGNDEIGFGSVLIDPPKYEIRRIVKLARPTPLWVETIWDWDTAPEYIFKWAENNPPLSDCPGGDFTWLLPDETKFSGAPFRGIHRIYRWREFKKALRQVRDKLNKLVSNIDSRRKLAAIEKVL